MKVIAIISLYTCLCALSHREAYGFNDYVIQRKNSSDSVPGVVKVKDIIIYKNNLMYSSFPSIEKTSKGDFILAFRRAPDRRIFGEPYTNHVDPNSYLMMMRSKDGIHWPEQPDLLYADPFGGSNDPCLLTLKDGNMLCASYGWSFVRSSGLPNLKKPFLQVTKDPVIFQGGYLLHSVDQGKTWQGPDYPPHINPEVYFNSLGRPLPAYNRGALYQGKNGRLYWMVAAHEITGRTSVHLIISDDNGKTWNYESPVAVDPKVVFDETSAYVTPKGDVVAFLRTESFNDTACIARSTDGGKSFGKWQSMGFQGHPLHALRLPDNRVLVTYGYRHKPYGIRARILNAECSDFSTAPEIILRDDSGNGDVGYSWSVMLDNKHILVVYYFNKNNGPRYIAGTLLKLN